MKKTAKTYKKNKKQKNGGFTLVEILLAVFIFLIIMAASILMFIVLFKDQSADAAKIASGEKASNSIEKMANEIRKINRGENGNYFFQIVEPQRIAFFSDVDGDSLTEKIEYVLDGTEIKRNLTEPGVALDYSGVAETSVVVDNVRNGANPIFTYYDSDYTGSEPALNPVNAADVSLVGISLDINTNINSLLSPIHIETKIHPRNLKNFN